MLIAKRETEYAMLMKGLIDIGCYVADDTRIKLRNGLCLDWWYSKRVCPSIHMPRRVCRILLVATEDAREERLQDITEAEAKAEGVVAETNYTQNPLGAYYMFPQLWDFINSDPTVQWRARP